MRQVLILVAMGAVLLLTLSMTTYILSLQTHLAMGMQAMAAAFSAAFAGSLFYAIMDQHKTSGAVVKCEQVPCSGWGDLPPRRVAGLEIWNAGRTATQIRDINVKTTGPPLDLQFLKCVSAREHQREITLAALRNGVQVGPDLPFEPIGRTLGPGEMWFLKMVHDQEIVNAPELTIVPVLGDEVRVRLKDPLSMKGFLRF